MPRRPAADKLRGDMERVAMRQAITEAERAMERLPVMYRPWPVTPLELHLVCEIFDLRRRVERLEAEARVSYSKFGG